LEVEGTQWLEEGFETGWWTYGMGVDVYGRDGGVGGGGEARGEKERRDEGGTEGNRRNIRRMRWVVELLKEGSDTPSDQFISTLLNRGLEKTQFRRWLR